MRTNKELRIQLREIDRKSYPAYKSLTGAYGFEKYILSIDHVQGDPFASPSSVHVEIPYETAGFPVEYCEQPCMRIAMEDYLIRQLEKAFEQYNFKAKGSGKSGLMSISRCGQEVLERSACQIKDKKIIVRFLVGFPAFGRTIDAKGLEKILFEFLPECIEKSLFYRNIHQEKLQEAVWLAQDQEAIRQLLKENGWVAFIANQSVLPRKSGVSQLPLKGSIPFESPKSMEKTLNLPHRGAISGMAIPKGITLIVGGGYHGKSTLLEAVQQGVYNHIAGDGREYVITDQTAVKLRAEDGRGIRNVNISMFINDLPNKKDTVRFSTEDASGSTSQAACLVEGIEAESKLFLIDEDTSATNFMVRDEFMQQVITRDKEPITPFLERAVDLYRQLDISTILVAGSSGTFFHIADHILLMDCYKPVDITLKVKELCKKRISPEMSAPGFSVPDFRRILPAYQCVKDKRNEHMKVKTMGRDGFSINKENIDIRYLEQLADSEQTAALAYFTRYILERKLDGKRTVRQIVKETWKLLEGKGWEEFCGAYVPCGLAKPRIQELYACINRFRG